MEGGTILKIPNQKQMNASLEAYLRKEGSIRNLARRCGVDRRSMAARIKEDLKQEQTGPFQKEEKNRPFAMKIVDLRNMSRKGLSTP